VDSVPHTGGIPYSSADLIIGSQANNSNYFDGSLDNVEIFDVALSPQEIIERYNAN
jgi:hypothetical protein